MTERVLTVGGNKATRPISDFPMSNIGTGKAFYVDAVSGDDGRSGRSPETAVQTIAAGYALLTTGLNDVLYLIGGASQFNITTALTWSKSYTHMVGLAAPGYNCRARIGNSGDLATLITVSGSGCIFKNFRIGNYGDDAADLGNVVVSGSRNYFQGVHFFGPGHATPAGETGARVLTLSGAEENTFEDCYIGGETIARTAASFIMEITGTSLRNIFKSCWFIGAGESATYKLVQIDNTATKFTIFEDCKFYSFSANHAVTLTEAFDISVSATQDVIFINPVMIGIAELDAGDVAGTWVAGSTTAAGTGIAVTPTT
jgi:hypothetical protein